MDVTRQQKIKEQLFEKYNIKCANYNEEDLARLSELVQVHVSGNEFEDIASHSNRLCLVRFLKGFGSTDDAFKAWLTSIEWRKAFGVGELTKHDEDIRRHHLVGRYISTECKDIMGRPICVGLPRYHNSEDGEITSLIRYTVHCLENEISHCNEVIADNLCFIFDLRGFSLMNADYEFSKRMVWILQNCYPERLGLCLFVNAPWVFYGCWQLIRPWLNEVTSSKIIFVNNDEQLRDFLDPDQLPIPLFD